ncbi:MAG: tetratricopeptide repeat protein [Oscillatoriales cyanobacterium]|uniref:tetratricopeptide repeat-containing S1 family peptidase n=1 Tax=Microcoleus sp. PH2017_05_CCC_O_A TaxID=2798816 RepID=UPI001D2D2D37|nr:tetratricopeptide repeat-containing serine protease family protein [Microcoleus sp. PH2017_05_CCC_O_A]MCC3436488.1 serine protease [Microcoleus sp. PH2017_05_CCC_O_A]TAG14787.1 MAG: tetratricopeptide repeat protein [Oscillatoriales cyanobacterium]
MNRDYSRFDSLASILAGTVTVAGIVVFAAAPVFAKTPQEIAKIAESVTLQINGTDGRSGTGFIIAKQGTTYTVLTAKHVVPNSKATYKIRSSTGKEHQVTRVIPLQKTDNELDLAVATFNSTETYRVVTLGDSLQAESGTQIFVIGYPNNRSRNQPNPEFTQGFVTSRSPTHKRGYTLRYTAITQKGMSGGPVFDGEGRVVGIHGEGELDFSTNDTGASIDAISKTGFNSAIPINTFLSKLSEAGLNRSALLINTSPTATAPLKLNNPQDAKTYYVRGLTRFDKGDLSGAVADFNQAIQTQSDYVEAYFYRALAYFDLRQMPKSIADYSKAIALNASYVDAYYNRGLVLSALGDKPGAIADYTQVIRLDRNFAAAYNNRGLALSDLGDQKGAIDDFNQALQINPGRANTYFNRGLALFRINNDRSALADYTQAIQLNPSYAKAFANRGITLVRMGDRQGAIADLQQAARLFRAQGMNADAQKALDLIGQLQRQ